jgi:hypothetical protein
MQLSFGAGAVWGERTDVSGSGIGPRQFGVLQDIQIDFDWTDKELHGQLQFPPVRCLATRGSDSAGHHALHGDPRQCSELQ